MQKKDKTDAEAEKKRKKGLKGMKSSVVENGEEDGYRGFYCGGR